jgi:hypothetical protein
MLKCEACLLFSRRLVASTQNPWKEKRHNIVCGINAALNKTRNQSSICQDQLTANLKGEIIVCVFGAHENIRQQEFQKFQK